MIVLHFDDRPGGIDDTEIDDGIDLHRYVVAADDVLRGHVENHRAQAEADDAINRTEDEDDARALGLRQELAEAEDHAALVLVEDLNRGDQIEDEQDEQNQAR